MKPRRALSGALALSLVWSGFAQAAAPALKRLDSPRPAAAAPAPAAALPPAFPVAAAAARPADSPAAESLLPTALAQLTSAGGSLPEIQAGAFDGTHTGGSPPVEPPAQPPKKQKKNSDRLFDAATGAVLIGAAVPVAWHAEPGLAAVTTAGVALLMLTAVSVSWSALKFIGKLFSTPRASPRRVVLPLIVGAILGTASLLEAQSLHLQTIATVDRLLPPRAESSFISGKALEAEIVAQLSGNPAGRALLDSLRDRGGVLHMPPFLVRSELPSNAVAAYRHSFDAVFINEQKLAARGWTAEQLLRDPDKQREYVSQNIDILVHELTHAAQARRWPLDADQWLRSISIEHEAFLAQHFYRHEQLRKNPQDPADAYLRHYEAVLDDLDLYLENIDARYGKTLRYRSPAYKAMRARWTKDWPAHQVEGYQFLARRHAGTPLEAQYLEKAAAARSQVR